MKLFKKYKKETTQYIDLTQRRNNTFDKLYFDDDIKRFKLTFGICDGNHGEFVGTTKQIRKQIDEFDGWIYDIYYTRFDSGNWTDINGNPYIVPKGCGYKKEWELRNIADTMSIIKYGYWWEFKECYEKTDYVIDNSICLTIVELV